MKTAPIPRFTGSVCWALVLVLVLVLAVFWFVNSRGGNVINNPVSGDIEEPLEEWRKLPAGIVWDAESEFEKHYAKGDNTIRQDLEIVEALLSHAVLLVKDFPSLFLADNSDFTNLFMGHNKQKFAWVHPNHSSVSEEGELLDRWGTPLFFHRESATATTLRSAGEDRELWTSDDILSGGRGEGQ